MISVKLNNNILSLPINTTLTEVLKIYGLKQTVFAVALNGQFIASENYATTRLQENDLIDVIVPMQGG
ncbi:MAG: sulfur carrier protein ThiS [Candidatus Berkiella sp.]